MGPCHRLSTLFNSQATSLKRGPARGEGSHVACLNFKRSRVGALTKVSRCFDRCCRKFKEGMSFVAISL